jgi:acetoacetyl-CoA reductase
MARVALVTGGTRGIGAAISVALKNAGYTVAANYAGNDAAAEKFTAETGIPTYKWSVADYVACKTGIARVEADLGPVEVLVNNAGITRDAPFHKMTPEQWHEVINTNLTGVFNMTHPIWPGMRDRKFGRVIIISSINGQKGQFAQVNYAASKAGDLGITKSLAQEGARFNITANAICPGYIATEMVMAVPDKARESIIAQIPTGRLGEPEEVARCVVFLAADDAGFINGSTISANGGQFFVLTGLRPTLRPTRAAPPRLRAGQTTGPVFIAPLIPLRSGHGLPCQTPPRRLISSFSLSFFFFNSAMARASVPGLRCSLSTCSDNVWCLRRSSCRCALMVMPCLLC